MSRFDAFRIHDLAAATFTPYKSDGAGGTLVDLSLVDGHCADLAKHGVKWAFSA